MRKAFIILLALTVLFSAGFTAAHIAVNSKKESVTWEEETLYGDRSAVEGTVVRTRNHQSSHLLWETEGTLGEALNPVTQFTFSNESIQSETVIRYEGIYMGSNEEFLASLSFNGEQNLPEHAKEKYADLIAYCKECFDSVDIGEEKEFRLDLREYMDYYSLAGTFDFPDSNWHNFNEFEYYAHPSYSVAEDTVEKLNDFFRIPILGDYVTDFSINRRQYGGSVGTSYAGGAAEEVYLPEFDAVYINGECYLTFDAVADTGEVADTSLIPGGYGLYRLNIRPDGEGGLISDDPIATMVYPMDPSEEFFYLEASDDSRHIYIHTWQGSKLMRTILDAETMECVQKIELVNQPENFYRDIMQYDDFLVILQLSINNVNSEANTVTVFAEDENGLYDHRFTVPMNAGGLDVNDGLGIFVSSTARLDFQNDTLFVAQNEFQSDRYAYAYGDNCNFYVLTYRPEGLTYAGKYHVNLSDINCDPERDDWAVKPFFDYPIQIYAN